MPQQTHRQQFNQGKTDFFAGRPRNPRGSHEFYHQGYNHAKELASLGFYYRYNMLSGGNSFEFDFIDAELKRLGVEFEYCEQPRSEDRTRNGRMYRISSTQGHKLPQDYNRKGNIKDEPYLPVTRDSGHSLYEMYYDFAEEQRKEFGYGDWIKVTP